MDDKLFELMTKMYSEFTEFRKEVKEDIKEVKEDIQEVKKNVSKLGAKIDGEISDKLKILSDEQVIMRRDILDIKYQQQADKQILLDIKLSTDVLNSNQKKQETKIIEIDRKIAK